MSKYIAQLNVGEDPCFDHVTANNMTDLVMQLAEQFAIHIASHPEGEAWVNCEMSVDGKITKTITISADLS